MVPSFEENAMMLSRRAFVVSGLVLAAGGVGRAHAAPATRPLITVHRDPG
jgi:hypothetical protein